MLEEIRSILMELLDVTADTIKPDSYLVRDLDMESIDFLELAVTLNRQFKVPVDDDTIFLRNMRLHVMEAHETGKTPLECLQHYYGYLPQERLVAMLADMEEGPVIQVRDLMSYIHWQQTTAGTS